MSESQVLNSARHVFRVQAVAHQAKGSHEIADRSGACGAERYACMLLVNAHQTQKVRIVSEHDAPLVPAEFQMSFICCAQETRVGRGRDIDAAIAQAARDRVVHVLVKVKPEHRVSPPR